MSNSKLALTISATLTDHPRANLVPWKLAINRAARGVFAELLFTVANGAIVQQTFEAYAAYILPQLHNIIAHSNPRPFAGNLEGYGGGASEDDVMEEDLIYPPQTHLQYPRPIQCNLITLLRGLLFDITDDPLYSIR